MEQFVKQFIFTKLDNQLYSLESKSYLDRYAFAFSYRHLLSLISISDTKRFFKLTKFKEALWESLTLLVAESFFSSFIRFLFKRANLKACTAVSRPFSSELGSDSSQVLDQSLTHALKLLIYR